MGKAILVLDEMPNNCGWCKLCDRLSTCMPTEYTIPSQDLDEGRPDWCPLKKAGAITKRSSLKIGPCGDTWEIVVEEIIECSEDDDDD